jgi:hypothetical protein
MTRIPGAVSVPMPRPDPPAGTVVAVKRKSPSAKELAAVAKKEARRERPAGDPGLSARHEPIC